MHAQSSVLSTFMFVFLISIAGASVDFQFNKNSCYEIGENVTLIGTYSGTEAVTVVHWIYSKKQSDNVLITAGTCNSFGGVDPGYPPDMTFTCNNTAKRYTATIPNVQQSENNGIWEVTFALSGVPTRPDSMLGVLKICQDCQIFTVNNSVINTTQSTVSPGTVVSVTCFGGYTLVGNSILTCQENGTWNPEKPICDEGPPECCCICCFIALIVNVVLNVVLVLVHVILTWQKHEFSVKKIYSGNNETNEAVCLKDYGIKAALPECCVCVVTIVIQIAVYFAALIQKDCGDSCDKCCEVVICLIVTIIVSIVEAAAGSGIIYIFVNVKGCSYVDQGGNVDSGDSACCGRNNSILPICAGDDQQRPDGNKQKLSQGPRHRDVGTHQPGEPNSKTTKTDESGSFVSGKDIKVDTGGSSSFRAQPPLPDIKSEKKNTRGLSANIDDSDINNPSYEKKRLTPIGQESHPGWEEKTDRSEDGKEKKKKRKSKDKDKERDSNVTESADL